MEVDSGHKKGVATDRLGNSSPAKHKLKRDLHLSWSVVTNWNIWNRSEIDVDISWSQDEIGLSLNQLEIDDWDHNLKFRDEMKNLWNHQPSLTVSDTPISCCFIYGQNINDSMVHPSSAFRGIYSLLSQNYPLVHQEFAVENHHL